MDTLRYAFTDLRFWVIDHKKLVLLGAGVVVLLVAGLVAVSLFVLGSDSEGTPGVVAGAAELSDECAGAQEEIKAFIGEHSFMEKNESPDLAAEFEAIQTSFVSACTILEQDRVFNDHLRLWPLADIQTLPGDTAETVAP